MGKYYANTKIFHFSDRLQQLQAGAVPSPVHIRLKPTNRCNHRCSYCCYRSENLLLGQTMNERDEIPPEKMRELVRDFVKIGVKAVTFSGGGEPLCYPHILDTIQELTDGGIKVAMLSNGSLLQGEVAELLARRATWIRVSMDSGDAESYSRNRNVHEKEFSRVCENLANFAAINNRRCILGLNFIVTRENSGSIFSFLEMAKNLGVDHVKVSGVVTSTVPAENDAYHQPFYREVRQQLDESLAILPDDNFSIINLIHGPQSREDMYQKDYRWCPMSHFLLVIGADQNIYTCQDKAYTESGLLGSIRDTGFADFLRSPRFAARLKGIIPENDCRHNCVAHSKNLMLLDYFSADPEHLEFV